MREEPNRHGRAADALIASYLRELADDAIGLQQQPQAPAPSETPAAARAAPAVDALTADSQR